MFQLDLCIKSTDKIIVHVISQHILNKEILMTILNNFNNYVQTMRNIQYIYHLHSLK